MARYPDSFIEEILERADLLELVGRHVTLKKSGVNWQGLCPFHNEKTPSFSVRPDKGFFKCFGCGEGGDALSFLTKIKGISFVEAVAELAGSLGLPLPDVGRDDPRALQDRSEQRELLDILAAARNFFRDELLGSRGQVARDYLHRRGLRPETMARFELGYAPPGWHNLQNHLGADDGTVRTLVKAGLSIQNEAKQKNYDRFRERIMFPIHNLKGQCVGFGGRFLGVGDQPKYINSPETALYRKGDILFGLDRAQAAIQREGQIILVEGYMDLIALANHGIENVVATLGTALTDQHLKLLWQRGRRILFCFDGDQAGLKAAWRALEKAIDGLQADRHVEFLFLPQGEDPDDVVSREGRDGFLARVRRAVPLIDFLMDKLSADLDLNRPEGKAAVVQRLRPHLDRVASGLLRELFAQSVGQRLGILSQVILGRETAPGPILGALGSQRHQRRPSPPQPFPAQGSFRPLDVSGRNVERLLLSILLRSPELMDQYAEVLSAIELEDVSMLALLSDMLATSPQLPDVVNAYPLEALSTQFIQEIAQDVLLKEDVIPEFPEEELSSCLINIQIRQLDRQIKETSRTITSDPGHLGEGMRILLGLKKERGRLFKKKCRPLA